MEHVNHTPVRNGKSSAVCRFCGRTSRAVAVCDDGEPDLFHLQRGWSEAPYPADCEHSDGSVGSLFSCPKCNQRLRSGERLKWRGESRYPMPANAAAKAPERSDGRT
jgi:hypothetical protein